MAPFRAPLEQTGARDEPDPSADHGRGGARDLHDFNLVYRHDPEPGPRVDAMTAMAPVLVPLDIARDRCKGCGLCIEACPKHVLVLDDAAVNGLGYHPVELADAAACTSCALCARVCPDAVFTVYAPARGGVST